MSTCILASRHTNILSRAYTTHVHVHTRVCNKHICNDHLHTKVRHIQRYNNHVPSSINVEAYKRNTMRTRVVQFVFWEQGFDKVREFS